MSENKIKDLEAQLIELTEKRKQVLGEIAKAEDRLGKAVQFRTKIEGAIEWVTSVLKRERDTAGGGKKEDPGVPSAERLSDPS